MSSGFLALGVPIYKYYINLKCIICLIFILIALSNILFSNKNFQIK